MKSSHSPHENSEIAVVLLRLYIVLFVKINKYTRKSATRSAAKTVRPSNSPVIVLEDKGAITKADRRPATMQTNATAENIFRSDGNRKSDE